MDTRQLMRWLIYFVLAALVAVFLYNQFALRQPQPEELSLQELASQIKAGSIASISIEGNTLNIERTNGG